MKETARAVSALPSFGWRDGMLSLNGWRILSARSYMLSASMQSSGEVTRWHIDDAGKPGRCDTFTTEGIVRHSPGEGFFPEFPDAPDLEDAATGGALLQAAWETGWVLSVTADPLTGTVTVRDDAGDDVARGATLGEACARALVTLDGQSR